MKSILFLILPWHLLTWSDFKGGKSDNGIAANSNISISFYSTDNGRWIHFDSVTVSFNTDSSTTNTDDQYVLNHEQQHLNLCQFICNRVNKDSAVHHRRYTQKQIDRLNNEIIAEWKYLDEKYDLETNHSLNHKEQEKWDHRIRYYLNHKP